MTFRCLSLVSTAISEESFNYLEIFDNPNKNCLYAIRPYFNVDTSRKQHKKCDIMKYLQSSGGFSDYQYVTGETFIAKRSAIYFNNHIFRTKYIHIIRHGLQSVIWYPSLSHADGEIWAQGVQQYGVEEDIWAEDRRGNRGLGKTTAGSFMICTSHGI